MNKEQRRIEIKRKSCVSKINLSRMLISEMLYYYLIHLNGNISLALERSIKFPDFTNEIVFCFKIDL